MYNAAMSIVGKAGGEHALVETLFEEMPGRGVARDRITYSVMMDAVWRAGTRTVRGRKDKWVSANPPGLLSEEGKGVRGLGAVWEN